MAHNRTSKNLKDLRGKSDRIIFSYFDDRMRESKRYVLENKEEFFINTEVKTDIELLQEWNFHCVESIIFSLGSCFWGELIDGELNTGGNVYLTALKYGSADFVYTEGIAIKDGGNAPVYHAWLVEKMTGAIFDPSWGTTGIAYYGVPFESAFIDTLTDEGMGNGVFDSQSDRLGDYLCFGFPKDAIYEGDIPNSRFTFLHLATVKM